MRFLGLAAFAAAGAALCALPALAGADLKPVAAFPYGDMVSDLLKISESIAALGATILFAKFAPPVAKLVISNQAISDAVAYAFASMEGAVAGQQVPAAQLNDFVGLAESYIIEVEPVLAKWLITNIRPRIIAYLSQLGGVPAEASIKDFQAPTAPEAKAV
jgi:hypothetical protein